MRSSPSSGQERPAQREHSGFIGIGRVDTPYCSTGSHGAQRPAHSLHLTTHVLVIVAMTLLPMLTHAQTPPFEWTYGANGIEQGHGVVHVTQCEGGGFIAVGSTESSGNDDENSATWGDQGIYIVRTNENGSPSWKYRYDLSELNEVAYGVIEISGQSEYVVVGSAEYGTGQSNVFLMKIDCDGDTIWTKQYDLGSNAVGYDVVEAANGNNVETHGGDLIVCGVVDLGPTKGGRNGFVFRVTSSGALIWSASPKVGTVPQGTPNATSDEWLNAVVELQVGSNSGDIVAAGTATDPLLGSGLGQQGYAVRLEGDSGLMSGAGRGVMYVGGGESEGFEGLCELEHGSGALIFVGWTGDWASGTYPPYSPEVDIYVVKTQPEPCNVIAQRVLGTLDTTTWWEYAMDVAEVKTTGYFGDTLAPGDVVLTGGSRPDTGYAEGAPRHTEVFVLPLETGNLTRPVDAWVFGDRFPSIYQGTTCGPYALGIGPDAGESIRLLDDALIVCGTSLSNLEHDENADISDLYLVRTDAVGVTGCATPWLPGDSAVTWADSCQTPALDNAIERLEFGPERETSYYANEVCIDDGGWDRLDCCAWCKKSIWATPGVVEPGTPADGLRLRPNPVTRGGVVYTHDLPLEGPVVTVEIVDSRGRVVSVQKVRIAEGSAGTPIATGGLQSGAYTVVVDDGSRRLVGRVVILQ